MTSTRRLYRSKHDRQIAGVCGGLAAYFNIEPTIVRLIFVLITIMGGPGLLLYIVLALVVPEESDEKPKNIIIEDEATPEE
jgi:phage shock protein C